jgi:hypothetical protein
LDKLALGLTRCTGNSHPKCAACQYEKQSHTPDHTTTTTKNSDVIGNLEANMLLPGDHVFCDHLESQVKGRLFHTPVVSPSLTSSAGP